MLLWAADIRNQGEPFVNDLPGSSDAREMKSKLCSKAVVVEDHKLIRFCLQWKKEMKKKPSAAKERLSKAKKLTLFWAKEEFGNHSKCKIIC